MRTNEEARSAGRRSRAPDVARSADSPEYSAPRLQAQRLTERFGWSIHRSRLVAELAFSTIGRRA